jgi:hypothetical protein
MLIACQVTIVEGARTFRGRKWFIRIPPRKGIKMGVAIL